jgi:lipoprotein-anchoring transpeptidase ErfK/SrfK
VTGNPNKGNGTPSGGVWAIDAKKSPATLGTMATMGYSSDVTYWMPFNGNVGLHDADGWRHGKYGGSIYKTNGSHGCVNLPYSAAETIYATMEIGSPVIVY